LADVNCISKVFFLLKSMFQETVINGNWFLGWSKNPPIL
jgi:hypothetical protein